MNIGNIKNCFGCGVCATVCPKNIISIKLNSEGFYEPFIIQSDKCTKCGLCTEVCSFLHDDLAQKPDEEYAYGAWSKDNKILNSSSSGGVGFEIARNLLKEGYKICACKYDNEKEYAVHYIATTEEELKLSQGSKYIQSYTLDAFKAIDRKEKYLVIGTPCQIDSFRRFIHKFHCEDNFILMDFFCHAVPSMLLWNQYLLLVKSEIGEIKHISWRNKRTGWHDSWAMAAQGNKDYYSRLSKGDIFYKLFLGDYCSNPACRNKCRFKMKSSSADLRIGDFWGKTYHNNDDGVSSVVAFSAKGINILKKLDSCVMNPYPFYTIVEGQMHKNATKASLAPIAMYMLKSGKTYSFKQWKLLIKAGKLLRLHKILYWKFKKIMHR